jgi:uncharacterized phiE125 gp8 family phage protein
MPIQEVTPAEVFPVSVAEARRFARVDSSEDDPLLETLIESATEFVRAMTGRQFVAAGFKLTLRAFPAVDSGILRFPVSPVIEVQSVKYRDRDGALHTLLADMDYLVDTAAEPATVEPIKKWPSTGDYPDAVQIEFRAGYADGGGSPADLAENVPSRAKVAIMALVAHWYENREATDLANRNLTRTEVPLHVSRLLRSLRVGGV